MGSTFATDIANMEGISMQRGIEIHLTSNFYPPIPAIMAEPCIAAIDAYWEDDTDRYIPMPDGVFYKGMAHAPAHAIIEQHKLYPWIEEIDEQYNNN